MHKLLLVDDEPMVMDAMYGYLSEAFELEIHRALSAFEAIELLRGGRFDLVISDISMPGMDGLTLLDFIKRHWPSCRVIILTGYDDFSYAYRVHQYKDVDFILKIEPFETIRRAVAARLEEIDTEERNVEYLSTLGERLTHMLPLVRRGILERVLRDGEPLPPAEELAHAELALSAERPVLLAIGQLVEEPAQEDHCAAYTALTRDLERHIRPRGMELVLHCYQERAIWFLQASTSVAEESLKDLAIYARESFFRLHSLLEARRLSALTLVISGAFMPWPDVKAFYSKACLRMQRISDQGGAMTFSLSEAGETTEQPRSHLAIGELYQLLQMFRRGQEDAFMARLNAYTDEMRPEAGQIGSQHPVVSSLSLLAADILHSLDVHPLEEPQYRALFVDVGISPYAAWSREVCGYMARLFERCQQEKDTQRLQLAHRVNDYVQLHYANELSLSDLAEHVHYNPSYLSRLYKETTGINILAYINTVRLEHARRLLKESDATVSEIAQQCGFFSNKYFHQVFRKAEGMSPISYRQSGR